MEKPPREDAEYTKVWKEGPLLKAKRIKKALTSVKRRWFVLRQDTRNGACFLDYYDATELKGTIPLAISTTIPRPGTNHFDIKTPGRVYPLHTENNDMYAALSWVNTLQKACGQRLRRHEASSRQVEVAKHESLPSEKNTEIVYYQLGDELLPMAVTRHRIGSRRRRQPSKAKSNRPPRTTSQLMPVREAPALPNRPRSDATLDPFGRNRNSVGNRDTILAARQAVKSRSSVTEESLGFSEDDAATEVGMEAEASAAADHVNEAARSSDVANSDAAPPTATSAGEAADDGEEMEEDEVLEPVWHRQHILRQSWPLPFSLESQYQGASDHQETNKTGSKHEASRNEFFSSCIFQISDLEWGALLGEGFFGRVYKAKHRRTGQDVVVKELKESDPSARAAFVAEISLLKVLRHPNVLRFVGIFCKEDKLHLITEFISGGSLDNVIMGKVERYKELPWALRIKWALDVACGMEYLHDRRVIHRDLKSENCLVRKNGQAVVADFGLARVLEGEILTSTASTHIEHPGDLRRSTMMMTSRAAVEDEKTTIRPRTMTIVGTPYFMAPELIMGMEYNLLADVFSFGVLLCELIGRIQADPDIMPRLNNFGIDQDTFKEKFALDCPDEFLSIAFACAAPKARRRPNFHWAAQRLRVLNLKSQAT